MSAEEKRARADQALQAINNAGWLFDEYVAKQQRVWMNASDTDYGKEEREKAWRNAHVALSLKLELASAINNYQDEVALREHRAKHREQ